MQLHQEYETVVILRPDLDDASAVSLVEKFEGIVTTAGGHILIRDDWGKRKLAYPIAKHQKGHYVLLGHLAPSTLVSELERRMRNEDSVIRFLTTHICEVADIPARLTKAEEQRKIKAEQDRLRKERGESEDHERDLDDERDMDEHDD